MPDLLTLEELRTARGDSPDDTSNDSEYAAIIPVVSKVISTYTGRDFGSPLVTEERLFEYDGSGFLDIDDCTSISQVALSVPNVTPDTVIATDAWVAMPPRRDDSPTFYYIRLPQNIGPGYVSPEMGFKRNFDVYYREHSLLDWPLMVKVTAQWGWPDVPEDVKAAAIFTVGDWLAGEQGGDDLTSESIEGFSRSWGGRGSEGRNRLAIPGRARDILAAYDKIQV